MSEFSTSSSKGTHKGVSACCGTDMPMVWGITLIAIDYGGLCQSGDSVCIITTVEGGGEAVIKVPYELLHALIKNGETGLRQIACRRSQIGEENILTPHGEDG